MNHRFMDVGISTKRKAKSQESEQKTSELCRLVPKMGMKISVLMLFVLVSIVIHAQQVKRVISLTPSITENIYLIGAESSLVGCTSYCTQAIADGVQQVGSAINVNVEKVFALQPDLVLTMGLTKPQDLQALEKLGITVKVIETPKTFEQICEQTLMISELLGHSDVAKEEVAKAKQKVADIQEKLKDTPKFRVFFQIGSSPIFAVLQNTFMDDYITFCNGENIAAGMKHGTITREGVLVKNPDVIILSSMGGFGKGELEVWKSYEGLSAAKNSNIFLVNEKTACSPTPKNFASALSDIFNHLNK